MRSRFNDPSTFCVRISAPCLIGSTHTRTFGTPSTVIRQFGQWPEQQRRPRGRWYLNEREKRRCPAAYIAEPSVSPAKPPTAYPSTVKIARPDERSISSPGLGGSLTDRLPAAQPTVASPSPAPIWAPPVGSGPAGPARASSAGSGREIPRTSFV